MLHHQGNLVFRTFKASTKFLIRFLYFFQRIKIVLYSSRLNGGNAGYIAIVI